ncbi:MAG: ParB/RepB/Spo0J family partition protein [Lachnospiraceae bacterium]|nr:ParB/RepB/Spo0J family partition protein [Lachnospiraceae bacterium]
MQKKGANISLASYDDIFSTDENREKNKGEQIQEVPLSELHPFKNHPFKVIDDEAMEKTVESIREYGVLTPAIVRPREEGGYELISGHRRAHASELAGKETLPVIVRNLDDDAAVILMVDSNLQRENILPSERAFALKMKLDAMKHQGQKRDKTSRQVVGKLEAAAIIGQDSGESGRQVQRYIRLTNLSPELLDMVDKKVISFNPAVELSYLKPDEQKQFIEAMDYGQTVPSLSQAQRIKKFSQEGKCTLEAMCAIMSEEKKSDLDRITIKNDVLKKYFPKSYTPKQMEDTIIKLLDQWQKRRNREQSL